MIYRIAKIVFCVSCFCCLVDNDLFAQDSQVELITIDTIGFNYFPSVSPDGNFVAYVKMVEEDYFIYGDIWLYDVRKDNSRLILTGGHHNKGLDNYLSWSNDSKSILFSSLDKIAQYDINTGEVEVLYETDYSATGQNIFAPTLNYSGDKIAFWKMDFRAGYMQNTHSIYVLNLEDRSVQKIHTELYNPQRGVIFYNPQWGKDDEYIYATFFDSVNNRLLELNVREQTSNEVAPSIFSTYFKVTGNNVYYTRYNSEYRSAYLLGYNIKTKETEIVNENQSGVFDVDINGVLFFTRNDSLYIKYPDPERIVFVDRGHNPSIQHSRYLLFEKWEETDNGSDEYINHIYMMRVLGK